MLHSILILCVIALSTFFMRSFPFFIFKNRENIPKSLLYLGRVLPPAIIALLIVYCLKNVTFSINSINEICAVLIVVMSYLVFRISVVSIILGTGSYMYFVQTQCLENFLKLF